MNIANAPEVGDPEMQALQQARLLALGMRTMTLPLGRGALTLGKPPPPCLLVWGASHPAVCAVGLQHVRASCVCFTKSGDLDTHGHVHACCHSTGASLILPFEEGLWRVGGRGRALPVCSDCVGTVGKCLINTQLHTAKPAT